jgi:hypothetical protein
MNFLKYSSINYFSGSVEGERLPQEIKVMFFFSRTLFKSTRFPAISNPTAENITHRFHQLALLFPPWGDGSSIIKDSQVVEDFRSSLNFFQANIRTFSPQQQMSAFLSLSNLLPLLDAIKIPLRPLFFWLAEISPSNFTDFRGHELAMTANAFANTGIRNETIMSNLAAAIVARPNLNEFKLTTLSIIVHSFATLDLPNQQLFARVANEIISRPPKSCNFTTQAIANIAWSFAKLNIRDPVLFGRLSKESRNGDHLRRFDPQEMANLAWSFATLDIVDKYLFDIIGNAVIARKDLSFFVPCDLSILAWAFATANVEHPNFFSRLAGEFVKRPELCKTSTPKEIANVLGAVAHAGRDEGLFVVFATELVRRNLEGFLHIDVSTIAWAYATTGLRHDALFSCISAWSLRSQSSGEITSDNTAFWANVVRLFATFGINNKPLYDRAAAEVITLLELNLFKPRSIGLLVRSFASVEQLVGTSLVSQLFSKVAVALLRPPSMENFTPPEISSVVWAFATQKFRNQALFFQLAELVLQRSWDPEEVNSRFISNLTWAFAASGIYHAELFTYLSGKICGLPNLSDFIPQALANVAWAFASFGLKDERLFDKISGEIRNRRELGFAPQNIANILWAYAKLKIRAPCVFERLTSETIHCLKASVPLECQDISHIVWAFGTMKLKQEALFLEIAQHLLVRSDLAVFSSQSISNIVWAFAKVKFSHDALFDRLSVEISNRLNSGEFSLQGLSNVIWAFADLNKADLGLFTKIADQFILQTEGKDDASPIAIVIMVWAFGSSRIRHELLFSQIAGIIIRGNLFDKMTPEMIYKIARVYSTNGGHSELFSALSANILRRNDFSSFRLNDIARIFTAFAFAHFRDEALYNFLTKEFIARDATLSQLGVSVITNLLRACENVNFRHDSLFTRLHNEIRRRQNIGDLHYRDIAMLANKSPRLTGISGAEFSVTSKLEDPPRSTAFPTSQEILNTLIVAKRTMGAAVVDASGAATGRPVASGVVLSSHTITPEQGAGGSTVSIESASKIAEHAQLFADPAPKKRGRPKGSKNRSI